MKSYISQSMIVEFKGRHFSKFPGKTHHLGLGSSQLKAAHPFDYFPGFLGKNIKNYTHPVNYSYLSP